MDDAEKIAAFDRIALVFTNQWADGTWSWWCPNPAGGARVNTRDEAIEGLVTWVNKRKLVQIPKE